ncbi:hypothetical protein U1Q18_027717 [Sarracenia purpurea var. burkii]
MLFSLLTWFLAPADVVPGVSVSDRPLTISSPSRLGKTIDELAKLQARNRQIAVAGDERRTGEDDARNRQIAEGNREIAEGNCEERRIGEDDALARVSANKTTRWLGFRV